MGFKKRVIVSTAAHDASRPAAAQAASAGNEPAGDEPTGSEPHIDGSRTTAEHFQALATSQILWSASPDGEMIQDSPSWRELTGQTCGEWQGLGWLNALHPADRERTRHMWLEAVADGTRFQTEYRVRRPDGSYTPVMARATPVLDADGTVRAWLGTCMDITEMRQTEERLREQIRINETLYRLGVSFARELDDKKLVQLVTDVATDLSGAHFGAFLFRAPGDPDVYRPYALSGPEAKAFAAFVTPATSPLFAATFRGETVVRLHDIRTDPRFSRADATLPGSGGVVRSYLAVPVLGRTGQVMGGLFLGHEQARRFTESHDRLVVGLAAQAAVALENARLYQALKESEAAARRAYDAAKRAERRKDEFLAMLGHELRNPLAPIVTALEILRLKRGAAPPDKECAVIERQVRHLTGLVDDLLDISRITRGKVELEKRVLDLAEVVAKAVEMASPLLEVKTHTLDISVPENMLVEGDPRRLIQVVSNLITNAAKYTEPGGSIIIAGTWERGGKEAVLRIWDNGIGIPGELLPHVFDLFTQADCSLDRKAGGLGIGLTVVKSLVALHGGKVSAHSEGTNRGSEFLIRLPAHQPRRAIGQSPGEQPAGGQPRGEHAAEVTDGDHYTSSTRILVVDDNQDAASAVVQVLEMLGYECGIAHDGPSALSLAHRFDPDVAILDIGLPVMDGYELATRLRKLPGLSDLRLIAVTGYGQHEDRARSAQAGIEAHLIKPVCLEALRGVLDEPENEAESE